MSRFIATVFAAGFGAILACGFIAPANAQNLNGIWVSQAGESLYVAGNEWALYEGQSPTDGGYFAIQQNVLSTQSSLTGQIRNFYYEVGNGRLVLNDGFGMTYTYAYSGPIQPAEPAANTGSDCDRHRFWEDQIACLRGLDP